MRASRLARKEYLTALQHQLWVMNVSKSNKKYVDESTVSQYFFIEPKHLRVKRTRWLHEKCRGWLVTKEMYETRSTDKRNYSIHRCPRRRRPHHNFMAKKGSPIMQDTHDRMGHFYTSIRSGRAETTGATRLSFFEAEWEHTDLPLTVTSRNATNSTCKERFSGVYLYPLYND